MSRKQIQRDLGELYIGGDIPAMMTDYYKKKRRDLLLLACAGILLTAVVFVSEWKSADMGDGAAILRNENGGGKKQVELEVRKEDGEWKEFSFELQEKEYSDTELEAKYEEATALLPVLILKDNPSLDAVTSNLDLVQEIEGMPFVLTWESGNPELIDVLGTLNTKAESEEPKIVELRALFSYGEWEREYLLYCCIYPPEKDQFLTALRRVITGKEENSRQNPEFVLPEKLDADVLEWRYPKGNSALLLGILFLILLPVIAYQKDREITKKTKEREQELELKYPEFLTRMVLYMETGMSISGSIFRIAEGYRKRYAKNGKKEYLYEELWYLCRQMRNGLGEKEAYELLSARCNLPCYKKLAAMLIQHLQKGGSGMLAALREEALGAQEERKKRIRKQGEEMGTKLLFPMMILLGIVMVLIMVPACFSFQM